MEDRNSPEAIKARSEQEDPIVMYLVVRESLGMGVGKTAAQCAHASQMLQLKFDGQVGENEGFENCGWEKPYAQEPIELFNKWLNTSFRKVVLRADDKEWEKLKLIPGEKVIVVDAGLTEIAAGSETVIGFWPMYKSLRPKLLHKLQVLK